MYYEREIHEMYVFWSSRRPVVVHLDFEMTDRNIEKYIWKSYLYIILKGDFTTYSKQSKHTEKYRIFEILKYE